MGDYNRYGEKDVRPGHFRKGGGVGRLYQSHDSSGQPSISGHVQDVEDGSYDPRSEASQERHAGKGPKGWSSNDSILAQVNEALYLHPAVDASDIDTRLEDDALVLSGHVQTLQQKKMAERIVENISGIKDVRNEIKIRPGTE
jgi:osmotically-inducible protein OsmY